MSELLVNERFDALYDFACRLIDGEDGNKLIIKIIATETGKIKSKNNVIKIWE